LAALAQAPGVDLVRHGGWFLFSFAFYLSAVILVLRAEWAGPGPGKRSIVLDMALILGGALLMRSLLLATSPSLSDDVFRYVWDGKVRNAGLDPYRYAPSAPELAYLRDPLWNGINFKSMPTPYPPLAEALFALAYRLVPDSVKAMQFLATTFDLGIVLLLIPMLDRYGLDPRRVLIYAWNPLVVVQFAHSAHYDAAMILPLLGAIFLLAFGRRALSAGLMGVSVLTKLVPMVAALPFLLLWGLGGTMTMGVVVGTGLAPWLLASRDAGGVLSEASDARFNDSLGYLLVRLLGRFSPDPDIVARGVAAGLLLLAAFFLLIWLGRRGADWRGLLLTTYWMLGLFILLNAVVEPWYLTWMVPFLCFTLGAGRGGMPRLDPALGWLLLSGFVVLTDLTYLPGVGSSLWVWVRSAEYLPLYGLLGLWGFRGLFLARRLP
jgi:hypothetical protein